MFDSNILDTLIGMVFVFMLISVASSWLTEVIAQILKLRAYHLKAYLKEWIEYEPRSNKPPSDETDTFRANNIKTDQSEKDPPNTNFVDSLYKMNPIITSLFKDKLKDKNIKRLEVEDIRGPLKKIRKWARDFRIDSQGPSYISSKDFVSAILNNAITKDYVSTIFMKSLADDEKQSKADADKLKEEAGKAYAMLEAGTKDFPDSFKQALLGIARGAMVGATTEAQKLIQARTEIEKWYDSIMERLMGRYKRRIWLWGLLSAFILVSIANVDTVVIARALWTNEDLRLATVASAEYYTENVDNLDLPKSEESTVNENTGEEVQTDGENGAIESDSISAETGQNGESDQIKEVTDATKEFQEGIEEIVELGIPMFWQFERLEDDKTDKDTNNEKSEEDVIKKDPYNQNFWLVFSSWKRVGMKFFGLSSTAIAASFGAQIWFDLLKQLVNVRGSGTNPAEKEKGKEKKEE